MDLTGAFKDGYSNIKSQIDHAFNKDSRDRTGAETNQIKHLSIALNNLMKIPDGLGA